MLDKRLEKIAALVSGEGVAVDVGTDHAYLAAELINSGKCSRVIASDVKEGPLESARNTVERFGIPLPLADNQINALQHLYPALPGLKDFGKILHSYQAHLVLPGPFANPWPHS